MTRHRVTALSACGAFAAALCLIEATTHAGRVTRTKLVVKHRDTTTTLTRTVKEGMLWTSMRFGVEAEVDGGGRAGSIRKLRTRPRLLTVGDHQVTANAHRILASFTIAALPGYSFRLWKQGEVWQGRVGLELPRGQSPDEVRQAALVRPDERTLLHFPSGYDGDQATTFSLGHGFFLDRDLSGDLVLERLFHAGESVVLHPPENEMTISFSSHTAEE
jgi:hypothetical protein